MRYVVLAVVAIVLAFGGWLAWGPSRIDPVAWTPPANPGLTGPFAPNEALKQARLVKVGAGPEDVARAPDGGLYAGLANGDIVRISLDGAAPQVVANTGGRPLGLEFAPDGRLFVADGVRGLLAVSLSGEVELLVSEVAGQAVAFANDLTIAGDGTVYFTDSTSRGQAGFMLDIWEGRPSGRLIAWSPASREARVVADGLRFPNGVALTPDETGVLVAEMMGYRVARIALTGETAGEATTFIGALPGMPDNVNADGEGGYWVALIAPREDFLDDLAERPLLRRMVFNFFDLIGFPQSGARYGWTVRVDAAGAVTDNLQDPSGRVFAISSVNRFDDQLVLGSIAMDVIAILPAPQSAGLKSSETPFMQ